MRKPRLLQGSRLIRIKSTGFVAGVVLDRETGLVIDTAPIVRFMVDWSVEEVKAYCRQRGWEMSEVHFEDSDELPDKARDV